MTYKAIMQDLGGVFLVWWLSMQGTGIATFWCDTTSLEGRIAGL